ncbi:MAG TPA: hypothetical protein VL128_18910 [Candidatus Eisenbacteria bacterium]|nr:hypothetical protein [Candidatus Eisenbacteria bacterium]
MKRSEKSNTEFSPICANMGASGGQATITHSTHPTLIDVVEVAYTTFRFSPRPDVRPRLQANAMAFIRRKGNAFYLVHNVRRGGKVQQLHLARLGDRARITDDVVKQVSKKHPFIDLNWRSLREQLDHQIDLADPESPAVLKLIETLRALNLDLADLYPQMLQLSESPTVAQELLVQLRLLHSTLQVKLDQLSGKDQLKRMSRAGGRYGTATPDFRGR